MGEYLITHWKLIFSLTIDHLILFLISIALATLVGFSLGILTVKSKKFFFIVPIVNALQSAPDLVLLALALVIFGLGIPAALAALFVKGVLPIIRNTHTGITRLDPNIIEAARGMGMSEYQILFRIEIPLAFPVILTGIRISSIMAVSTLTLSAYIGVNSLGVLIAQGIAMSDNNALLAGSILTAILAIGLNYFILFLERRQQVQSNT